MLPVLRAREKLEASSIVMVGVGFWTDKRGRASVNRIRDEWQRSARRRDQVALTDLPPALAEQRLAEWGIPIEWVTTEELEAQARAQQLEVIEEADE